MRLQLYVLAALACAGIAFAQDDTAPMVFRPRFEAEPGSAELIRNYPPRALTQNVSGLGVLCCTPNADHTLTCAAHSEFPEGQGFGAATVRASSAYRLTPDSYADLAARPGTQVRLSMIWAAPIMSDAAVAELRQKDADSIEACLPPAE